MCNIFIRLFQFVPVFDVARPDVLKMIKVSIGFITTADCAAIFILVAAPHYVSLIAYFNSRLVFVPGHTDLRVVFFYLDLVRVTISKMEAEDKKCCIREMV